MNFIAGAQDNLTFGLSKDVRQLLGANGDVNDCSGFYKGGEWTGFGLSLIGGFGGGLKAAEVGFVGDGLDFSHWIPNKRLKNLFGEGSWMQEGFGRSVFNGNLITPAEHYLVDGSRWAAGWQALGPRYNYIRQQINNIPTIYYGIYGYASATFDAVTQ